MSLLLVLALLQDPSSVEVALEARPERARVGERVEVLLRARHGPSASIEWPKTEDSLPGWRVRDRGVSREEKDGRIEERRLLEAFPTAPGKLEIPPQVVRFRREGREGSQTTRGATIEVASVLGEGEADLRPLKAPIGAPPLLWPWIAGSALLLAGALLLLRALRRRRRAAPAAPPVPPHERALRLLEELARRSLADPEAQKAFYYDLSMAVRDYIEGRFGLRAPERTTEEFLEEAAAFPGFALGQRRLLGSFLEACDLVKYACHLPTREEVRGALDGARRFVEETRPDRPPAPVEAAA
ncbi:MAG TPA: hypothetical protein VFI25_18325 [Planctomycetota bacterium]|jgi:hypothetical protein|nr:hypothetical protein [Planctomycetota bacterium]